MLPKLNDDRIVPLIVAVALFMENMDSTVIATSLPAIARAIGTNPLALKLAVTSYRSRSASRRAAGPPTVSARVTSSASPSAFSSSARSAVPHRVRSRNSLSPGSCRAWAAP